MLRRARPQLTAPMLIALLALFVALSSTSVAAPVRALVTGKAIKDSTITHKDVKNGSLRAADFKAGALKAGPKGEPGATGPQGPAGPAGPAGAAGLSGYEVVKGAVVTLPASNNSLVVAKAACPAGKQVLSGGVSTPAFTSPLGADWAPIEQIATENGQSTYTIAMYRRAGVDETDLQAYAVCASVS